MTDLPLAELRHRAGLTQEELAERAGLTARSVRNLERSVHRPRRRTAARLRAALGVRLWDLDDLAGAEDIAVMFGRSILDSAVPVKVTSSGPLYSIAQVRLRSAPIPRPRGRATAGRRTSGR